MTNSKNVQAYETKPVEKWNVRDFHVYMQAEHLRKFGVSYAPMRSWRTEQGLLGNIIGTAKKDGTHDKALIKAFIDRCFANYKPNANYPGISFGFCWTYMQRELQLAEIDARRQAEVAQANEDVEELSEWL